MNIGVLGSGAVGQSLAAGFVQQGHKVMIGTGHAEKLQDWQKKNRDVSTGDFTQTAQFGELIVLAIKGEEAESILKKTGIAHFQHKIVIDVTNPLLFQSPTSSPTLTIGYPHSLGEKIQKLLPKAKVVKAFNMVTAAYMTKAKLQEGTPDLFIAGNDSSAKKEVTAIASKWGWPVIDLGGIEQSYLLEALAMIWIRYGFLNNHWTHAFKLLKK